MLRISCPLPRTLHSLYTTKVADIVAEVEGATAAVPIFHVSCVFVPQQRCSTYTMMKKVFLVKSENRSFCVRLFSLSAMVSGCPQVF